MAAHRRTRTYGTGAAARGVGGTYAADANAYIRGYEYGDVLAAGMSVAHEARGANLCRNRSGAGSLCRTHQRRMDPAGASGGTGVW
jgi:hypothetical protein